MTREEQYIEMEAARIDSSEQYFSARPQIDTNDRRKVFEAGFDRGWKAALSAKSVPAEDDYFGTYDGDDFGFNLRNFYSNEKELIAKGIIIPLYTHPQPPKSVPEGWVKAANEELVMAFLDTAEYDDDYDTAKRKLDQLIQWHIAVATDPQVNGGYILQPEDKTQGHYEHIVVDPTEESDAGVWPVWVPDGFKIVPATAADKVRGSLEAQPDGTIHFEEYSQADKVRELEAKYNELIMAVASKFPNETRHETALRYIRNAESSAVASCRENRNE